MYLILPIGIAAGYVLYHFIGFSEFSVSYISQLEAFGLIAIIGITEEIFFRSLLQNAVTNMTDSFIAITFTSILYGLFHYSSNTYYVLVFIILSILYCGIYNIWKNIYISIGLNITINVVFYLLSGHLLVFAIN